MYRRTRKYAQSRKWRPRPEVPESEQRPVAWRPPLLRRRLIIIDYDGPEPVMHTADMYRTNRIDSYRVVVDGSEWKARVGWSRFLDGLRRAMPRLTSTRNRD